MQPIYFNVGAHTSVMAVPDTQAHVDGHPVLTYNYHLYNQSEDETECLSTVEKDELSLNKNDNPNYVGYITFEVPGKVFSYTANGHNQLSQNTVHEIIEQISHYRDNPELWQLGNKKQ